MVTLEARNLSGVRQARRTRPMCGVLRSWILEQSLASNVGHIGSALGIVEIIAALWGDVLQDAGTESPTRDRFILSKGHAALALYGALRFKGLLSEEQFATYCGEGSLLGAHPEHALPGIDVSTGSLGQGLSIGCGLAYGLRQQGNPGRVFVLLSDAECNEGSVWEAVMFAAHPRLAKTSGVPLMPLTGHSAGRQTAPGLPSLRRNAVLCLHGSPCRRHRQSVRGPERSRASVTHR